MTKSILGITKLGGIAAWTAVFHKQSKEEIATDVAFF
jgi:hypothetical protein